jgi:fructose-bisphosphate aldolase class II
VRGGLARLLLEGEIGKIGSNPEIVAERPAASLTFSTPEEAVRFVRETGVDVLAPAVGSMTASSQAWRAARSASASILSASRKSSRRSVGRVMTLHDGPGTADELRQGAFMIRRGT